ncbi:hypothetical protein [Sphingobium cupriresistens]|uniref:Uncharacterized protein n=1 Tax=Sphingobium cupriresistens LL01 TaxID=1420583 RepID=A0A0J7XW51_9SPHN|nr:hypothetical protein [Sphingobium cupriresistens]KMS55936.1 hypothetical protein V473_13590 [Sphingobium cupriresistens LL01]
MDKFIYVALGVGVLLIAAVDQSNNAGQATSPTVVAVTDTAQSASSAIGEASSLSYTETAPPDTLSAFQPVNPIPRADALGGKIIDDRFQPDG